MLSSEWHEATFQLFKESPSSVEIFDIIGSKLNEYIEQKGLNKILETSNGLASSYCGLSFKKDQLLYHCR